MIDNFEYFVCEKNDKSYSLYCLDVEEYNVLKKNFEFVPYLIDFDITTYLIRNKEVIMVDEDNHSFDLYKSKNDFEEYLDLACRGASINAKKFLKNK